MQDKMKTKAKSNKRERYDDAEQEEWSSYKRLRESEQISREQNKRIPHLENRGGF